eukprot:CAMPEP_0172439336 /NCGR_PEP_ID=MMETSP1065-20121228/360_1 /TAXON_ID=265537 /ORGANISM="Amphiprora paludosa, Strain CCMP125" /LENGTH=213 /DNA_ID=CAMNT_0013188007 /DNA_START=69 /DNA_END=710 /DNA_ORIENTATION=-
MKRSMYQRQESESEMLTVDSTAPKEAQHHKRQRRMVDLHAHPTETLRTLYFSKTTTTVPKAPQSGVVVDHGNRLDHYTLPVVNAIRSNNVATLQQMWQDGTCFEACNNQGESLLHLACRRSNLETIQFLVETAQVQIHVCDDLGRSIFHDVCWRPTVATDIMAYLLPHLSNKTLLLIQPDARGHTPLDYSRPRDWVTWNTFWTETQVAKLLNP